MAGFSGAVKIRDLSDFIAPSQACALNLDGSKVKLKANDDFRAETGLVEVPSKSTGFAPIRVSNDVIKVSLHDCLACSGCVTSAETVLLQHQSTEEFFNSLRDPSRHVVVSLSPQSRTSLAAYYGMTPVQAFSALVAFFKGLGVKHVLDTTFSRDIALIETAEDFIQRYKHRARASEVDARSNAAVRQHDDVMMRQNGDVTMRRDGDDDVMMRNIDDDATTSAVLPLIASSCPGWVCYAEKTHGDVALPYISTAKSPQAVMGTLVKRKFCRAMGYDPASVYHVCIMPCYDKKLEASRDDFLIPGTNIAEVDSVLATTEVHELLQQRGVSLQDFLPAVPHALSAEPLGATCLHDGRLYGHRGGSGGYLEYVFRRAAKELFGKEVPEGELPMRVLRNSDMQEITLDIDGKPALRFALAYGFRNIQSVMRKLKRKVCEYDFIEIMACPSGCLNGGGQIKAQAAGSSAAQQLEVLDMLYNKHPDVEMREPHDNDEVRDIYTHWIAAAPCSVAARELFHTSYHKREKLALAAISDW